MAKFTMWASCIGDIQAVKVNPKGFQSVPVGKIELGIVNASTSSAAIQQAKKRIESGLFVLPLQLPSLDINKHLAGQSITKKAIYCDFNGVLDDPDKESTESHPCFKYPQEACPHKVMKLVKLALKHDAKLVLTSLLRDYGLDMYSIIGRCLAHSGIEEYESFIQDNIDAISELCFIHPTDQGDSRSDEIAEHIIENKFTHFVVFEDTHQISEKLNPVMCDPFIGLTDELINIADKHLIDNGE